MRNVGHPTDRIDGPVKVSGRARYAADEPIPGLLHGAIVTSTIAHGTVVGIDTDAAQQLPGVVRIFTHRNMPKLRQIESPPAGDGILPLQDASILHEGQPLALVIATTIEQAHEAARRVRVSYRQEPFRTDFLANIHVAEMRLLFGLPADAAIGEPQRKLAEAEVTIDQTYLTADRHHSPMEPSATLAIWMNQRLVLRDAVQGVTLTRQAIAQALGLEVSQVEVQCDFVGGGFGCKGYIWPHQLLAAAAARKLKRPVRVTLSRSQTFTGTDINPLQVSVSAWVREATAFSQRSSTTAS